jgi:hypothetical protein
MQVCCLTQGNIVTSWIWFIGASHNDTQILGGGSRQQDMHLIAYNGQKDATLPPFVLMPTYHYAKQLRQTFDLNCTLRHALAGGHTFFSPQNCAQITASRFFIGNGCRIA